MTAKEDSGVYFNKLNDQEKESKILNLLNMARSEVTVWQKGSDQKFRLELDGPLSKKYEALIVSKFSKELSESDILINFSLSGLNFFAKGRINSIDDKSFLCFDGDFFKSERRANFRLLTDPHHDVYVYIKQEPEEDDGSNVVNIKTKTSETGLFKNFLSMMSGNKDTFEANGYLKLRVLDISVSGAALKIGEFERDILAENMEKLGRMYLDFNGEMFNIPGGKIHYIFPVKSKSSATPIFKAGVEFVEVDTNLDEKLSALINRTLRGVDKEFEDFLK